MLKVDKIHKLPLNKLTRDTKTLDCSSLAHRREASNDEGLSGERKGEYTEINPAIIRTDGSKKLSSHYSNVGKRMKWCDDVTLPYWCIESGAVGEQYRCLNSEFSRDFLNILSLCTIYRTSFYWR